MEDKNIIKNLYQELIYKREITVDDWDSFGIPTPSYSKNAQAQICNAYVLTHNGNIAFESALEHVSAEIKHYYLNANANPCAATQRLLGYLLVDMANTFLLEDPDADLAPENLTEMLNTEYKERMNEVMGLMDAPEEPWDIEVRG